MLRGVMDITGWVVLGITALAAMWLVWDVLRYKRKFISEDN